MVFQNTIKVGCTFQIQKYRSDGTITYNGPTFHNTILNSGLHLLDTNSMIELLTYCNVGGSNSSIDVVTQSGLLAPIGSTNELYGSAVTSFIQTPIAYAKYTKTFNFPINSCLGNLNEIGVSLNEDNNYLNRQLLPDTITVILGEGLRVTVSAYIYSDMQVNDTQIGNFLHNSTETINYIRKVNIPEFCFSDGRNILNQRFGVLSNATYKTHAYLSDATTGFTPGTGYSTVSVLPYNSDFSKTAIYIWEPGNFIGTINSILFCFENRLSPSQQGIVYSAFYLVDPNNGNSPLGIEKTSENRFNITLKRSWGRYVTP